ncbi:MAG: hypothetical protein JXA03_10720 [Bacteroidales bacterium]|nr:hypothetical protein [Bacteroidales bacterium]
MKRALYFCLNVPALLSLLFSVWFTSHLLADGSKLRNPDYREVTFGEKTGFILENDRIASAVYLFNGKLLADSLYFLNHGDPETGYEGPVLVTDADFRLEVIWTGQKAPGNIDNADNILLLTKEDFVFQRAEEISSGAGNATVALFFKGLQTPFVLRMIYSLDQGEWFARRMIDLRDTLQSSHFLHKIESRYGKVRRQMDMKTGKSQIEILKDGGFGQPVALTFHDGGSFLGMECPIAENTASFDEYMNIDISCGVIAGRKITTDGLQTGWVVTGITRRTAVKHGFMQYLDDVRARPAEPCTLHNDWFEIQSVNIYDSTGKLNENGPIIKPAWEMVDRVNGDSIAGNASGFCPGDKNAGPLFLRKMVGLARDEGISFFKWDGLQFSCNETGHGHPIGIYSRRSIFENVARICDTLGKINPGVRIAMASGAWLSPWWLKYMDQISLETEENRWEAPPSLSENDKVMSSMDISVYYELVVNDRWFPMSNLMISGITKGDENRSDAKKDPPDKFMNNAILDCARGNSCRELNTGPAALTEEEWQAITESNEWAEDRKEVLKNTFMAGGNPAAGEPYAYVHFNGEHGIIAARNPGVMPGILKVNLDPAYGLPERADSLVLDRLYPMRWIAPVLYPAGAVLSLPLEGFETAVYELYPLSDATLPLVAGIDYEATNASADHYSIDFTYLMRKPVLLNPEMVSTVMVDGREVSPDSIPPFPAEPPRVIENLTLAPDTLDENAFSGSFTTGESVKKITIALLLESSGPETAEELPGVSLSVKGIPAPLQSEEQKGKWAWHYSEVGNSGDMDVKVALEQGSAGAVWNGSLSVWVLLWHELPVYNMSFTLKENPVISPLPPRPRKPGTLFWAVRLGKPQRIEIK